MCFRWHFQSPPHHEAALYNWTGPPERACWHHDELLAKKKQGVHVRLIISEESSNRPFYQQLSENFDLILIPHHGWDDWNRMHDKFCIIDFEYVMHGSYNWTKAANYNDETLATALDRDFVKKFSDEFIRLYGMGRRV